MSDTLIDLGELPGDHQPAGPGVGRAPFPYRWVLGALAVVLVATLTTSAPRPAPPGPAVIAAALGENIFVTGERVLVVSAGPERFGPAIQDKFVTEYALPSGAMLSRTTVAVTGAIFSATAAGGVLLVSSQADEYGGQGTVAMALGTKRALWRVESEVVGVSEADGVVLLHRDNLLDASVDWSGVDLTTGREIWSLHEAAPVFVALSETVGDTFAKRLIVQTGTGRLRIYDTVTGAVVAGRSIPATGEGGEGVWAAAGLVLVGDGGRGVLTAYAADDLTERWHTAMDRAQRMVMPDCGPVICVFNDTSGMRALDAATGRELWTSDRWSYAERTGSSLLVHASDGDGDGADGDPVLAVLDPLTGAVRGDFGRWERLSTVVQADGTLLGKREQLTPPDTTYYARLDPRTMGVRVLGRADRIAGDCQTGTRALVCRRLDASIGIWPLG